MANDDEREELRDVARRVLSKESSTARVRETMETPSGGDPALWRMMADLGWLGLEIPESCGGAGGGFGEVAVVLEELGRHVTAGPFLSTVVIGTGALLARTDEDRRCDLLSRLAAGELRIALVAPPVNSADGYPTVLANGKDSVLTGTTRFVLDGRDADLLLVIARSADGEKRAFLLPATTPGIERRAMPTIDLTRRMAEVSFDGVGVPADAHLDGVDAEELLSHLIDRAAAALACDSVGGARRVMEMSVEYAKVREQFGRPIGTFQAIKHKCADMLVLVETAQVAAENAAVQLADAPDAAGAATAIAKWYACDAYAKVAGDGIQVHGGIGFTWDYDLQLYFKRAKLSQALFGNSIWHRRRLADFILPRARAGQASA